MDFFYKSMTTINRDSSTSPFKFSYLIATSNFYVKVGCFLSQAYSTQCEPISIKNQSLMPVAIFWRGVVVNTWVPKEHIVVIKE